MLLYAQTGSNPFGYVITNETSYVEGINRDTFDVLDTICKGEYLSYQYLLGSAKSIDSVYAIFDNKDTIRGLNGSYKFNDTTGLFVIVFISWLTDFYGVKADALVGGVPVYIKYCIPTISLNTSDSTICQNECIRVNYITTNTPETYEWYFEGAEPDLWLDKNPPPVCYKDTGTYTIKVIVSNPAGTDTATAMLYVAPDPSAWS